MKLSFVSIYETQRYSDHEWNVVLVVVGGNVQCALVDECYF